MYSSVIVKQLKALANLLQIITGISVHLLWPHVDFSIWSAYLKHIFSVLDYPDPSSSSVYTGRLTLALLLSLLFNNFYIFFQNLSNFALHVNDPHLSEL